MSVTRGNEISLQIYSQNEEKYVAATPLRDNNL